MITDAIAAAVLGALSWLVGLLPEGTIDMDGFGGIWIGYAQWNTWLPLTELLACIVAYVGLQVILYGYLALRAARSWLPFI
jgi:hypothetical protein